MSARTDAEWREVVSAPAWKVSNDGRIRGPRGIELTQQVSQTGHRYVQLRPDGRRGPMIKVWTHRAVLDAFVGPCPPGMEARHIDGNPSNNQVSNLAWGNRFEQRADDRRNGVRRTHAPRLSLDDARAIRHAATRGESSRTLCRRYGLSHTSILKIVAGKRYQRG